MRCPFCGSEDTKVVDSRSYLEGNSIKRRRECVICQRRFSTFERVEEVSLYVIKKDQRRVPFNREKVMRGLTSATVKRNISREELEKIVYEVEKNIQNTLKNEIGVPHDAAAPRRRGDQHRRAPAHQTWSAFHTRYCRMR